MYTVCIQQLYTSEKLNKRTQQLKGNSTKSLFVKKYKKAFWAREEAAHNLMNIFLN